MEGLASPCWHLIVSEDSRMTTNWKLWMEAYGSSCSVAPQLHLDFKINLIMPALLQPHLTNTLTPSDIPSICQACSGLRAFALAVLLLEELFLQTLTCLAPSCLLNPNPHVISDHPFKVPSAPHITVKLTALVYFLQNT